MKRLTTIFMLALMCVMLIAPMSAEAKKPKKKAKQETKTEQTEQTVQITRSFLGFTLGTSTKEEVITKLKEMNYEATTYEDGTVRVKDTEVKLGGSTWVEVRFYFSQNVLFDVLFISKYYDYFNSCVAVYEPIAAKLKEKYNTIVDNKEVLVNAAKCVNYKDQNTGLNLAIRPTQNPHSFVIVLNYYDVIMWANYGKEVLNEI